MPLDQAIAFFLFSLVAAITPGPSNVMLTASGAISGIARGLPCLVGVAAGMGLLIFGVALGIGQVITLHPAMLTVLNWLGAAFLLYLAWKIAVSGPLRDGAGKKPVGISGAAQFQWINPKSWLVSTSAAGAYLHAEAGALLQALAFAGLFVAAALPSGFLWLAFGASLQRYLRDARTARIVNGVMAAGLAASVAMILW